MIETILRKRAARHIGEIGLYAESEMADEDLRLIGMGNDVTVTVRSEAAEAIRKFMWALAGVVAKSVEGVHDKEDGMDLLCIKCRHMTHKLDPVTGKLEIRRKSTLRIGGEVQLRLLNRMLYVTVSDLIPGTANAALREELERMTCAKYPTEAPIKTKLPRNRPAAVRGEAPVRATASEGQAGETQPTGTRRGGVYDLRGG